MSTSDASLMARLSARLGRKPRVLFIASAFPPANRPSSPRSWNVARSLAQCRWDVTVLTVEPSQWVRRDGDAGGVRRIAVRNPWPSLTGGLLHSRIGMPFSGALRRLCLLLQLEPEIGWLLAAARASRALRRGDVDVVFATVAPFGAASLAMRIAERLAIPFVLDYRDLWSLNPMQPRLRHARQRRTESKVVRRAAAITIISPSAARLLAQEFGIADKVRCLPNGFHRDELRKIEPQRFDHFAIVYAGTFYPPKRSVAPLFRALQRLAANDTAWRFHYYGPQSAYVQSAAQEAGLPADRVVCHGFVPRSEALAAVAGADLVAVVTSVYAEGDAADLGIVTGKIYEAIGLDRPLLVIAPRGSDVESIVATAGRGRVISGTDIDAIAAYITDVAAGRVPSRGGDPDAFEWTQLGRRLSDTLAGAVLESAAA